MEVMSTETPSALTCFFVQNFKDILTSALLMQGPHFSFEHLA